MSPKVENAIRTPSEGRERHAQGGGAGRRRERHGAAREEGDGCGNGEGGVRLAPIRPPVQRIASTVTRGRSQASGQFSEVFLVAVGPGSSANRDARALGTSVPARDHGGNTRPNARVSRLHDFSLHELIRYRAQNQFC